MRVASPGPFHIYTPAHRSLSYASHIYTMETQTWKPTFSQGAVAIVSKALTELSACLVLSPIDYFLLFWSELRHSLITRSNLTQKNRAAIVLGPTAD